MKKYTTAAVALLVLTLLWAPGARGQDATVGQWMGTWTPIGQLPAGQRHAPEEAQMVNYAVRLAVNNAQGQVVMGNTQYKMENLKVYDADRMGPVDHFSFAWEPRPGYWVSCTLAGREGDQATTGIRYSGLCWDENRSEGWMEMWSSPGQSVPTPQQGRPDEG